jgi:universal stress protein A
MKPTIQSSRSKSKRNPLHPGRNALRSRKTPQPAAVVPGLLSVQSILVPIDFSAASEKALAYAVPFARQFGAKLTLLHVVEPVNIPHFASLLPMVMENEKMMENSRQHLDQVVKNLQIDPELVGKTLVRYGRSYNEITTAARTLKADLIILSTHGYTGVKHILLGSTTERVVRHAPCPVLVVRPREHEFVVHGGASAIDELP